MEAGYDNRPSDMPLQMPEPEGRQAVLAPAVFP